MAYVKKSALVREDETASDVMSFIEDSYGKLADLLNGTSNMLDDLNVHGSAGIHESKITGNVDAHAHIGAYNLGERVIGDTQLQWWNRGFQATPGVRLIRTNRAGCRVLWGVTPAIRTSGGSPWEFGGPKNVFQRVEFVSIDGSACPFPAGSVVQVVVCPMSPPQAADAAPDYDTAPEVEYTLLTQDWKGFDLWVCTDALSEIPSDVVFFSYIAFGWSVI